MKCLMRSSYKLHKHFPLRSLSPKAGTPIMIQSVTFPITLNPPSQCSLHCLHLTWPHTLGKCFHQRHSQCNMLLLNLPDTNSGTNCTIWAVGGTQYTPVALQAPITVMCSPSEPAELTSLTCQAPHGQWGILQTPECTAYNSKSNHQEMSQWGSMCSSRTRLSFSNQPSTTSSFDAAARFSERCIDWSKANVLGTGPPVFPWHMCDQQ